MRLLQGSASDYAAWASDYFEKPMDNSAVARLFRHHPLDRKTVADLNPEIDLSAIEGGINEIGILSRGRNKPIAFLSEA